MTVWWPILVEPEIPDCATSRQRFTDLDVVGDLHQIVHLGAASDSGFPEGGTVYADVGAELHVVFEHDDAHLRNLVVHPVDRCEPETVGPDHRPGVDHAAVADPASVLDHNPWVQDTAVAPTTTSRPSTHPAPIALPAPIEDPAPTYSQWADAGVFAKLDVLRHHRRRMDSRRRRLAAGRSTRERVPTPDKVPGTPGDSYPVATKRRQPKWRRLAKKRASSTYFGLWRKLRCSCSAVSRGRTPLISWFPSPTISAPRRSARSEMRAERLTGGVESPDHFIGDVDRLVSVDQSGLELVEDQGDAPAPCQPG